MKTALIIPVFNPGSFIGPLVEAVKQQTMRVDEWIVIDSSSTDGSVSRFRNEGIRVITIPQNEFDHGGTRQRGVELTTGADFVLFLTQDAIPVNANAFELLLNGFRDLEVAAIYGRQLPRPGAPAISAHARLFNYSSEDRTQSRQSIPSLGIKSVFFSNSFSAYRRSVLMKINGFPRKTIFGEDTYIASKLILAGHKIHYCAGAQVYHSHSYPYRDEFKRYFDIGVFHSREPWIRANFGGATGEGMRFITSELKYLFHHNILSIPSAWIRTFLKYLGFQVGLKERLIPVSMKKRISLNREFWNRPGDRNQS